MAHALQAVRGRQRTVPPQLQALRGREPGALVLQLLEPTPSENLREPGPSENQAPQRTLREPGLLDLQLLEPGPLREPGSVPCPPRPRGEPGAL